jgi:hypothetical protein
MSYTDEEIKCRVKDAIDLFYRNDSHLIVISANERSCTHKVAEYLQRLFPLYNVDCEYNRHKSDPKRAPDDQLIIPDIVIHKRGSDADNVLVIETKKDMQSEEDIRKVKALTKSSGDYCYQLGSHLIFYSDRYEQHWYKDGKEVVDNNN